MNMLLEREEAVRASGGPTHLALLGTWDLERRFEDLSIDDSDIDHRQTESLVNTLVREMEV